MLNFALFEGRSLAHEVVETRVQDGAARVPPSSGMGAAHEASIDPGQTCQLLGGVRCTFESIR